MLQITDLTFRIAGRPLLENASATIPTGHKCGLVGRNGTGKTSLFKLITGEWSQESGSITVGRNLRIGQVAQEAPGTEKSLIATVLEADTERSALLAAAETESDPDKIADIHTRLADIGAHSAEARAGAILNGLGFDAEAQKRPCSSFSGGWRMRVALAAVLFTEPDILLLDEPTNYLDMEGTLWLENYIQRYPHTVLIISHDRDLLNSCVSSILHLDNRQLTFYAGNYDRFARTRAEKMVLSQKLKEKQDAKRKHMESFINRFKAKASKARQAQSRLKALERMGDVSVMLEENVHPFRFPSPEKMPSSPIIRMESLATGYEVGKPILKRLNLRIDNDDRIALLGSNGNGKSTFAKLLEGRLAPQDGTLTKADKLSVALFAQHQLDDLHADQSAFAHFRALFPKEHEAQVRARVAATGLATEKMDTPAKDLSGGERARLTLGLITAFAPHVLILDEPTNHLDIDSRAALADAINDYKGAIILISHDRSLVESCAERIWLVENGDVHPYDGDMDDYRALVLSKRGGDSATKKASAAETAPNLKDKRKASADLRKELAPMKKKINELEGLIEKAQNVIQLIDAEFLKPSVSSDGAKIADLSKKRADAEHKLAAWEEKWLTMSDEYDSAIAALDE